MTNPTLREQADEALARLAAHQREIDRLEAEMNQAIDEIKTAALEAAKAHETGKDAETAALKSLALKARKELFGEARTLDLPHGELGFRLSTALALSTKGHDWDDVLAALKEQGRLEAVRVTQEVNKDVLKTLPPAELAGLGLKLKTSERFFCRPTVERLA